MTLVLANGCFDVLHIGHLWHLKAARRLGTYLIVALTEDAAVNKGPGRPIHQWEQRAELLRALRCVDLVIPSASSYAAIRQIRPHIFVKGVDYEDSPLLLEDRLACSEVGAILHITTTPKLSSSGILSTLETAWTSSKS